MANISNKAYLGLDWIITLILAIIPFTNVILGIVTRAMRGHILAAICNFIFAPVFYIVDLVTIIVKKDVTFFA